MSFLFYLLNSRSVPVHCFNLRGFTFCQLLDFSFGCVFSEPLSARKVLFCAFLVWSVFLFIHHFCLVISLTCAPTRETRKSLSFIQLMFLVFVILELSYFFSTLHDVHLCDSAISLPKLQRWTLWYTHLAFSPIFLYATTAAHEPLSHDEIFAIGRAESSFDLWRLIITRIAPNKKRLASSASISGDTPIVSQISAARSIVHASKSTYTISASNLDSAHFTYFTSCKDSLRSASTCCESWYMWWAAPLETVGLFRWTNTFLVSTYYTCPKCPLLLLFLLYSPTTNKSTCLYSPKDVGTYYQSHSNYHDYLC